jgi:uncharacterized repeat protein (TIGR01451 family)
MKISQRTTPTQATAALAVGLIAMPAAMAVSHPTASRPKPPRTASAARASRTPGLTISISDGHVSARAGDKLTYTVSVRNSGTVAVRSLKVTQTLPPGLEFLSASDHGMAARGDVSWTASLPVGGKRTFADVTRVTRTPPTLLRLAAVACVTLPGSSSPVVCAAHLDRLPALAATPTSRSGHSAGNLATYTAAGLAALALGLLTVIVARRRVRLRRQPALPATPAWQNCQAGRPSAIFAHHAAKNCRHADGARRGAGPKPRQRPDPVRTRSGRSSPCTDRRQRSRVPAR